MNRIERTLLTIAAMLAVVISGCSSDKGTDEKPDSDTPAARRSEHDREGAEHDEEGGGHGEEGEESGAALGLDETYDNVRNGARLIMAYDAQGNSFTGTVENTTDKTLSRVRVEVHLSSGKELGPTTPVDLEPGEKRDVRLTATSKDFDGWSAHPEVGIGEHAGGEERGEHDREGQGEHR